MPISAITFDMWETLLFDQHGNNARRRHLRCSALFEALQQYDVEVSLDQLLQAYDVMPEWFAPVWRKHQDVSVADQLHFLIKKASQNTILLKETWLLSLQEAYASAVFELPPTLNPHAVEVFTWLQRQNKKMGIICNTGRTPGFALRRFLDQQSVSSYFMTMLFSDEVGVRKPGPHIFHLACQRLGVQPNAVVHVGDSVSSDIAGAKVAGWKAIHFVTQLGRDQIAERNPNSLMNLSRNVDKSSYTYSPDYVIASLDMLIPLIQAWENQL